MQSDNAQKLLEFVEAGKEKGASDEFLTSLLVHQGWTKDQVYQAMGAYWQAATGLTLPEKRGRAEAARDAFLHLLAFSTLATWASALGSMWFEFINHWFPDPVTAFGYGPGLRVSVTWQMASIVVAFPIFAAVARTILRDIERDAERLESSVRKWLTYLALLLTAGGMICDLIWFLDQFLAGELTTRFVLKVLVVLIICGAIFLYYFGSLRWDKDTGREGAQRRSLRFALPAGAVLLGSVLVGLSMAGTPVAQRKLEADSRRVQQLRSIASAMQIWFSHQDASQTPVLPARLDELVGHGVDSAQIIDPETNRAFEYFPKTAPYYQLCATFAATSELPDSRYWRHGPGRQCFTFTATATPGWQ